MNLSELKQYPHKIAKIDVTNKNNELESTSETALLKITLPKAHNEIIIFSYDIELEKPISRTQSGDDYFLTINNVEGTTIIYAHFLILDLYDNDEEDENDGSLVEYDVATMEGSGTNYIQKDNQVLSQMDTIGDNTLKNREKNPNYKQYNIDVDKNNKPIKGRFPISSRYSSDHYCSLV